ncbi:MAG TPA: hypothetical protein VLW53_17210, partial [Candidatus Eisenbacteria bacterium]|nr:hypothetical protein [Candidatus Eisenbacteria bacterium]
MELQQHERHCAHGQAGQGQLALADAIDGAARSHAAEHPHHAENEQEHGRRPGSRGAQQKGREADRGAVRQRSADEGEPDAEDAGAAHGGQHTASAGRRRARTRRCNPQEGGGQGGRGAGQGASPEDGAGAAGVEQEQRQRRAEDRGDGGAQPEVADRLAGAGGRRQRTDGGDRDGDHEAEAGAGQRAAGQHGGER